MEGLRERPYLSPRQIRCLLALGTAGGPHSHHPSPSLSFSSFQNFVQSGEVKRESLRAIFLVEPPKKSLPSGLDMIQHLSHDLLPSSGFVLFVKSVKQSLKLW